MHLRRLATAVVVSAVALLLTSAPASAHPFGEPQTVTIAPTADGVRVEWRAEPDDVTALAAYLGVVGGSHVMTFEDGAYVPEGSSVPAGVRLAEEAAVLEDYLLTQVDVVADGTACAGGLEPVADVEVSGAALSFDCGGPVGAVDVGVATLVDLDDRYRILATGPEGQRHVYAAGSDTTSWVLGDDPGTSSTAAASSPERSAAVQLGSILGAVALGAAGVVVLRRRRHG